MFATNIETNKHPPEMIYLRALGAYWKEYGIFLQSTWYIGLFNYKLLAKLKSFLYMIIKMAAFLCDSKRCLWPKQVDILIFFSFRVLVVRSNSQEALSRTPMQPQGRREVCVYLMRSRLALADLEVISGDLKRTVSPLILVRYVFSQWIFRLFLPDRKRWQSGLACYFLARKL